MADAAKTKEQAAQEQLKKLLDPQEQERMKQSIEESQREQERINRARSTGSRADPGTDRPRYDPLADLFPPAEPQAAQPVYDSEIAAAAVSVIMPEAPAAPLATDGEQYSLFGELSPEEKLQAHVSALSEALEEEILAIDADPAKDSTAEAIDAIQGNEPGTTAESLKAAQVDLRAGLRNLREFLRSPEFKQLAASFADFSEWIKGTNPQRTLADFLFLGSVIDYYRPIIPFFLEEIERLKQEPGRENLSLRDFMRNVDEGGNAIVSLFEIAAKTAAERAAAAAGTEAEAAAIEKGIEQLPMLQALTAASHVMPNNPLMNALQQKPAINAGAFDLVVSNASGRRKEITAYAMITYDPGETGVTMTAPHLTEYERQVSDAVISLWLEAEKNNLPPVFSPDMIFRAMPGGSDKPSAQQKGAIARAIEKFRGLLIFVDATDEMKKRGVIGATGKYVFDEKYLNVRRHTYRIKNGGMIVQGYELLGQPVILTYSKLTNQLLTVPAKYIAVEKVKRGKPSGELVTMTADRQAMTGYLLRRIAVMKHDKKNKHPHQSTIILFDTLFTETGTATSDRKQTMLNRNFCFEVLDYWKATGYIKDYKTQQKGRSISGIEILL